MSKWDMQHFERQMVVVLSGHRYQILEPNICVFKLKEKNYEDLTRQQQFVDIYSILF